MKADVTQQTRTKALIVPGVGFDLTKIDANNAKMVNQAQAALMAIALQNSKLDVTADQEKAELKDLTEKLSRNPVGKRMNQLRANRMARKKEKEELKAGTKYLMKFFKENNIKIDISKIQIPG